MWCSAICGAWRGESFCVEADSGLLTPHIFVMDDRWSSCDGERSCTTYYSRNPALWHAMQTGPYAKSREQFLKEAQANGIRRGRLCAWHGALLVVAEIVRDAGGSITPERLRAHCTDRSSQNGQAIHHPTHH